MLNITIPWFAAIIGLIVAILLILKKFNPVIEELTGKRPRVWYELWELFYHFAYFSMNS